MKAAILELYGKSVEQSLIDSMMAAADTDKDGEIDIGEFKLIMRAKPSTVDESVRCDAAGCIVS